MTHIKTAGLDDLPELVTLFDGYRIFYGQASNVVAAETFLRNRIQNGESHIFLADEDGTPAGFAQLYPLFSSVSMQTLFVLNDLYVVPSLRRGGIGEGLLARAQEFCRSGGHKGLVLETSVDNPAQHLYEKMGWVKDVRCFHYFWTV